MASNTDASHTSVQCPMSTQSLGQPQHAGSLPPTPSKSQNEAANVALPASRESSFRYDNTHTASSKVSVQSLEQLQRVAGDDVSAASLDNSAHARPALLPDASPSARSLTSVRASIGSGEPDALSIANSLQHLEAATAANINHHSSISLPPSRAASSGTIHSSLGSAHARLRSLEELERLDPVTPCALPLPGSTGTLASGTATNAVPSVGSSDIPDPPLNYWTLISEHAKFLPHLQCLVPDEKDKYRGRHRYAGKVTCIDFFKDGAPPRVNKVLDMKSKRQRSKLTRRFERFKGGERNVAVASRVILVEDLCTDLIEMLGATFNLNPEFFAEHLNRSGHEGEDYRDTHPTRWSTSQLDKPYTSMTWCRPVLQNADLGELLQSPNDLLSKPEASTDNASNVRWRDSIYTSEGRANRKAKEHRWVVDTNIFRQSWSLSARPLHSGGTDEQADYHQAFDIGSMSLPAAWQERVTFCLSEAGGIPTSIFLLDPLPAITDLQIPLSTRKPRESFWSAWGHRSANDITQIAASSSRNVKKTNVKIFSPMTPRVAVNYLPNRVPSMVPMSVAEAGFLRHFFTHSPSLFEMMAEASHGAAPSPDERISTDLMRLILGTIERDTNTFFRSIEWALDDISHDSLDDFVLAQRLSDWRRFMANFEIEVPAIGKRLKDFVRFVFNSAGRQDIPNEVNEVLEAFGQEVGRVRERLDDAYTDLRADMQFAESRRSITETKTVTRLTELAFIFVPLSFCASLFSKSIRELDTSVSVWIYVVTALGMVILAYSVRFFIGSDLLGNSIRRSFDRVNRTGVSPGWKPSRLVIVRLTAQDIWNRTWRPFVIGAASALSLPVALVIPIVLMWTTTNMDKSFKSAVTLLILLGALLGHFLRLGMSLFGGYRAGGVGGWSDSESDSGEDV